MAQVVDPNVVAAVTKAVEALQLPSAKQRKRIRRDAGRSLRQMSALMGELGVPVAPETIRTWEADDEVKIRDRHAAAYKQLLEALERAVQ
jgi:hypothetical protein